MSRSYQLAAGFYSSSPSATPLKKIYRKPWTSQQISSYNQFLHSFNTVQHGKGRSKVSSPSQQSGFVPPGQIRNYSIMNIYTPHATSESLEADPSTNDIINKTSLANDKVENWTSPEYHHLPFQPDFSLFEPIHTPHNSSERNLVDDVKLEFKSRLNTNLCERLVYLIQHDPHAAEQLKSEIINDAIDLPASLHITYHCFDLLFQYHDTKSYLEWLPLVAVCHLNQASASNQHPPISTAEIHLNELLKLAPHELPSILYFLKVLVSKECFSRHLSFTIIRHLVRTQSPATTISFMDKILSMLKLQSFSLDLIKPSQDFLILQLANQGHLSDALQLFYAKRPVSINESEVVKSYPLLYQVLADQLVSRMNKDTPQASQDWISKLENLISLWRMDHEASLQSWLTPETRKYLEPSNQRSLTKQISKKYDRIFSKVVSVNAEVCQEFSLNQLVRFTAYFWSLFNQGNHPKFVKAAKLANEIHQIIPLRQSVLDLQEKFKPDEIQNGEEKTEEQILKSIVFKPPALLLDMLSQTIDRTMLTPDEFKFETRSDIVFLWAHSWMIFYHRSGQPHKAIQVFLDYFIPMGCDLKLLDQIQYGSKRSPIRKTSTTADGQKYHKLIHPTTGVLTVLYDSILSITPPKLIQVVFESFLTLHFDQHPESVQVATSSMASKRRLEPNLGSFRPFVKEFLRFNDVDGALYVLKSMHFHLSKSTNEVKLEDEGGWIDLLEWCALHSSGPKPNKFDPHYHWGDLRKKKIKGWDGKMKEDLIFITLNKFFQSKFLARNSPPATPTDPISSSTSSHSNFLESPHHLAQIKSFIQESKKIKVKNLIIEEKLNFLNLIQNEKINLNFPSLKLILKIKFGFFISKNSNGLKFINKLLSFYK